MLWWHILFYLISIHLIVHLVRSQDEDEESTTIPLSTTTDNADESVGIQLVLPGRTVNDVSNNGSDQNININDASKQRIIIALAVLCAAFAVLLGFLVSIVVCQWWQHDKDDGFIHDETGKIRSDLVGSSYISQHDPSYRQAVKL